MRSLLFILPLILGACNDNVITNTTGSGGDPDPTAHCDFIEYDQGTESSYENAQFIDTLPALSERIVCGTFTNLHGIPPMDMDYDDYLFPLVSYEEYAVVNFAVETDLTHTPLLEVFFQNEEMEEPVLVGSFVGANGVVAVLDWPIGLTGEIKNDLFVSISAYSQEPDSVADYVFKYW